LLISDVVHAEWSLQLVINHKLKDYQINKNTEILILGTFLPETFDEIEFFYGSKKNQLWDLLPSVFNEPSLTDMSLQEKKDFMTKYKIDFLDLILAIDVPHEEVKNRKDSFIDDKVVEWNEIIKVLQENKSIKKVFFTRKTPTGIPNIYEHISMIENFCTHNKITCSRLITPSKAYRGDKLPQWKKVFNA